MWTTRYLSRMDGRVILVILGLMFVSLLVLAAFPTPDGTESGLWNPLVQAQLRWFALGFVVYVVVAGFDYNMLREWTWVLYTVTLLALIGLFFTEAIQNVHRWYRIPFIKVSFQPSEPAKLVVVIALAWFLERRRGRDAHTFGTACLSMAIAGVPFLLILKQPDLGSALIMLPMTLVMFYFGDVHPWVVRLGTIVCMTALMIVAILFLEVVSHETARPIATRFIREYQFERFNPKTHHQQAAITAISIGGLTGAGFGKGEYTKNGWLPEAKTDSVFASFGEEFGLIGLTALMALFYALIYYSFQVTALAKDAFGRLLSAGVTVYLAMHILFNIGMMSGVMPITGVPLVLVTYGGSSVLVTMTALGILQSIYSRRFMF